MAISHLERESLRGGRNWKHAFLGGVGIVLGGVFLWLAMRNVSRSDIETTLLQMDVKWLGAGVIIYLALVGLRCLRWGFLLRGTGSAT
jgi:uncharacterized membrane protein YbhN (UPF0104 family)